MEEEEELLPVSKVVMNSVFDSRTRPNFVREAEEGLISSLSESEPDSKADTLVVTGLGF